MPRAHVICTVPHYMRHIRPIYEALPEDMRGDVLMDRHVRARRYPVEDVFLVAGFGDVSAASDRRVIYIEHGAGQRYSDAKPRRAQYYSGSEHPPNVVGYVCPNEHVAKSWAPRPAVVVGCPAADRVTDRTADAVVITFHWDATLVCPEARSARPHYIEHLHEIVNWIRDNDYDVVGHWHPRDLHGATIWRRLGVEAEPDPDAALARAMCVIADNTSFAYEAGYLGAHNLVLNAPWYRREIYHGLRFWDYPPGPMFDDADWLMNRPLWARLTTPGAIELGTLAADRAYGRGTAADASEFIQGLIL